MPQVPKLVTPLGERSPPTFQSIGEPLPCVAQLAPPPLPTVTSAMYWRGVSPVPLVLPAWNLAVRLSLICQSASKVT
ncbi:hypothetical protein D3C72_1204110 [compost metagenome]